MATRIAVTGGIAEGKSTVVGYCRELGLSVASADSLAAEVYALPEVLEEIGDVLALPAGFTRDELRQRVSHDPEARRALNGIMHPRVLEQMKECPANIVEVPLLFETCLQGLFDRVWVVTCGSKEQLRRLTHRLGDENAAKALIATQLTSRAKSVFADVLVRTNEEERSVRAYVIEAVRHEFKSIG